MSNLSPCGAEGSNSSARRSPHKGRRHCQAPQAPRHNPRPPGQSIVSPVRQTRRESIGLVCQLPIRHHRKDFCSRRSFKSANDSDHACLGYGAQAGTVPNTGKPLVVAKSIRTPQAVLRFTPMSHFQGTKPPDISGCSLVRG
jgi:hypothetical protein